MPMNNECTFTVVNVVPVKPTKPMVAAMKKTNPVGETRVLTDNPNVVIIDGRYTDNPRLGRDDAFTGVDGLGGLPVVAGQNRLFELNREWRLTDVQIVAVWNAVWNNRGGYAVDHVVGARRDYNRGTGKRGARKPAIPVPQFRVGGPDDDGYIRESKPTALTA